MPRTLPATIWFLLLGVLLPLPIAAAALHPTAVTVVLAEIIVVHCAAGLAAVLTCGRLQLMQLGFWAFAYLFLGLTPLAEIGSSTYPVQIAYPESTVVRALLIIEIGLLAYSAGAWLSEYHRIKRPGRIAFALLTRSLSPTGTVVATVGSLLALVALLPRFGGLHTFFSSRQASNQAIAASEGASANSTATSAVINWGLSVPPLWALLGVLALRHRYARPSPGAPSGSLPARRRFGARVRSTPWWVWLLCGVSLAVNVVVNNPISQPRFWAGTVLLSLAFRTRTLRRPPAFRLAAVGLLFLLIVVFPYSDYFRYQKAPTLKVTSISRQLETNDDFDAFAQMQTGVDYTDTMGFAPTSALGPVFFWVPRNVWAGKPGDFGSVLGRFNGYTLVNRSAPLWIEVYHWGGFPVLGVVFAGLGYVERRADELFDGARDGDGRLIHSAVPVLAFFQLIVLRGSLLQATAPLVLLVTVPLAMAARSRRRAPW